MLFSGILSLLSAIKVSFESDLPGHKLKQALFPPIVIKQPHVYLENEEMPIETRAAKRRKIQQQQVEAESVEKRRVEEKERYDLETVTERWNRTIFPVVLQSLLAV